MKHINSLLKKGFVVGIVAAFPAFQSCTDNFESINSDPNNIYDEDLLIDNNHVGSQVKLALQNIYAYSPVPDVQLQQNLIGDIFSGYMMSPTPFAGNANNMTYNLVDGWNQYPWQIAYNKVMAPLYQMELNAEDGYPDFKAWAKIIRVEAMHRVSDIYGPVIYSQFGSGDVGVYDCQQDVYSLFFEDLEEAINTLTDLEAQGETANWSNFDMVYGGDVASWIRFANSLRLRLAIRVSDVDPDLAKTQAEAAMSHEYGVISTNMGNFMVASESNFTHPLNVINNDWNDIRMSAPMESYLVGYEDPRLPQYFQKSVKSGGSAYNGIRQGIAIAAKADYEGFSKLAILDRIQLMTAAEVYLLRAEGALRGWNMQGTAQELYEEGISLSLEQHNVGDAYADYIADDSSTPKDYIDPVNEANNVDAPSDITIKWDDAASFDTKLEKIITQKWIAMFPEGEEAWAEFRRTGYPKLFPVMVNNSGGTIKTDEFVKRINFSTAEFSLNEQGVSAAESCPEIGGAANDNGGTALWWDID